VSDATLPLFPLRTVLFPGGEIRLRIFEQRYLDLIRTCARQARPFGVCLILEGSEVGAPALPAAFGTSARIVDFFTLADGLLGIAVQGEARFHVRRSAVRDSGLIVAEVDALADRSEQVLPQHGLLVELLDRLLGKLPSIHAKAERWRFDCADWVGYRLAELLPITPSERQALLQCDCPHERLDRLIGHIPEFQRLG